jgi:hypothetical protein
LSAVINTRNRVCMVKVVFHGHILPNNVVVPYSGTRNNIDT